MKMRTFLFVVAASAARDCGSAGDASADGGFLVLVHKSNDVDALSKSELKRAVTGGIKQWGNGAAVQLGLAGETPETQYLSQTLNMSPRELVARIQEQVFKGEMRRPVVLRSSADCVALVRSNAGAICVANTSTPLAAEARAVPIR